MANVSRAAERVIEELSRSLEVPQDRYESADRSYRSVCSWLERTESVFSDVKIDAYIQGSFRLGTAIRPVDQDEHYDLDVVFEFGRSKQRCTQRALHTDLGFELGLYAKRYDMQAPEPWKRCWTLNYADGAQFHMDLLPSVPDAVRQRTLREQASVALDFVDKSISITDSDHKNYRIISDEWPSSNPNGYAEWFYDRMKPTFERLRKAYMIMEAKADVAAIPAFRIKTPLQSAIQILKRHRDLRFSEEPERKPASIVITTLSAHAYEQESTLSSALYGILERMDRHIEERGDEFWIANPSDPSENFADSWNEDPDRRDAFYDWLETARDDFRAAASTDDLSSLTDTLAPRLGRNLVESAVAKAQPTGTLAKAARAVGRSLRGIIDAPHRKPPSWPMMDVMSVRISTATETRSGFRPIEITSDGPPVRVGSSLRFVARTNVDAPYKVYWQVVNTGQDAVRARQLRGGFDEGFLEAGLLTRIETARYRGTHSIECFVVKNGYCVARSGPFLVNID